MQSQQKNVFEQKICMYQNRYDKFLFIMVNSFLNLLEYSKLCKVDTAPFFCIYKLFKIKLVASQV